MATKRASKPCPECGKSLHVEAVKCSCGWQDARAAARQSSIDRHACQAFGCPLPGTLFASAASSDGWCYLHHTHRETLDVAALTAAINARHALLLAAYAVYLEVDGIAWWGEIPGRYARPFRDANRADLLPTPEERKRTVSGWLARVRRDIEAEILTELGVNVRSGKRTQQRTYAPTDDDLAAAHAAEQAIADGTWRNTTDLLRAAA